LNENSSLNLKRDGIGRMIKENQDGFSVESRYGDLGKRIEVTSSLGASIKIERNEAGLVKSMLAENKDGASWEAQFNYNALGLETERLLPGGIMSSFQYDRAGHPVEHKVSKGTEALRHRVYSWNVNDRLQSMMNGLNSGMVQYGHDDFGNLAWAKYEDNQFDYRMPDKVGNLYKTKEQKDRKYGAGGQLLESNGTKYNYDEEGNLIIKILPDEKQWKYEWAGNGMLKAVIRPDGKEVNFEYDAIGRRTAKIFNGSITRWVWDGNAPLHEWKYEVRNRPKIIVDELGEVGNDKDETSDNLITWIFDEGTSKPAARLKDGKMQSIITDYLGKPLEMYNSSGNQTWKADYDIYGKIRKQLTGAPGNCPFRFQGQYEDEETSLYYNRFRYYNPDNGLYITQDPVRLNGGFTFYTYVGDPNTQIDEFGLAPFTPKPVTEGSVFRGVKPGQPAFSPSPTDLAGMDHMPGISSKPKNNASTQRFFEKMGADVKEIDVTKLNGLQAVQDGKDHVSLKPSNEYLEKKGMTEKQALEDWAKGGDEHELSKELKQACK